MDTPAKNFFRVWAVCAVSLLSLWMLAACGGGGAQGEATPPGGASATTYSVGGTITGLAGTVVLQNNGADTLALQEDGDFTFATELEDGNAYTVTLQIQPEGQNCTVASGSGNVAGADVTDVAVACTGDVLPGAPGTLRATAGDGTVTLAWSEPATGATVTGYRLFRETQAGVSVTGTPQASPGNVTAYTDSGLTNGATYFYKVVALSATGEGPPSNEASATPSAGGGNIAPVAFDNTAATDEDTPVSITLTATDRDGTVASYSIVAEPGNGSLTGSASSRTYTPNADFNGTDNFTFEAMDDDSAASNVATVSITVAAVNDAPTIDGTATTSATEDVVYHYAGITAEDVDAGDTLTFSMTGNPDWLSIDPATGALSGTPGNADVGTSGIISATVTDSDLATASLPGFTITVANVNDSPNIGGTGDATLDSGALYDFTPTANDVDVGDTLEFSIVNQPSWALFDATTGNLQGMPSDTGADPTRVFAAIDICVTDNNIPTPLCLGEFAITVNDATPPANVSGLTVTVGAPVGEGNVLVSWTDPSDSDLAGVLIRRTDTGAPPLDENDGQLVGIFAADVQAVLDGGLILGTTYQYTAFSFDEVPMYASGATYPATPQPLYTIQKAKRQASDPQIDARFGHSVAVNGNYAIVGAWGEDAGGAEAGAAYAFHRTGTNTWDAGTKLTASDAAAGADFGNSVAIGGDYAVVGAVDGDAAYVFHRTGTNTWDAGTKLTASDGAAGAKFGNSVAISGDYAIVGAWGKDDGGTDVGAAYVFRRTDVNTWDAGVKLVASDAQDYDLFGTSLAISGDYAVVGARYEDAGGSNAGAAYVFRRTGVNTWDTGAKLTAFDAQADDLFGTSVAINGDYTIVGAFKEDGTSGDPLNNRGAAYVFRLTGNNTWNAGVKLTASGAQADDWFGISVAIGASHAIVGAVYEDTGGSNAGAAYIFD